MMSDYQYLNYNCPISTKSLRFLSHEPFWVIPSACRQKPTPQALFPQPRPINKTDKLPTYHYQDIMWPNNNGYGNQGGYGNPGWNNQGTWNQGPQGAGFVNLGGGGMGVNMGGMGMGVNMGGMGVGVNMGGMGVSFNRWGSSCGNYQSMNGYTFVDYSQGWNPNYHDQLLRTNIDYVFQQYDFNFSGQLHGQEFFYAYRDLCLRMGLAPPMDYQSVWNAAMASDVNGNGQVSKMELFMLFKRIQGINATNNGWNL